VEELTLKMLQNPLALIEDFGRDCRLRGMTEKSIRRYISSLKIFAGFLIERGLSVNDVDVHVLRDFLQHVVYGRKAKHETVENYFSALSAFYDYLAFEGYVSSNIVLANEPTGNLDAKTKYEIVKLLEKLNVEQGTTIVMVTHDSAIASHARRVLSFSDGENGVIGKGKTCMPLLWKGNWSRPCLLPLLRQKLK
jgi:site-specific recombinase XerD